MIHNRYLRDNMFFFQTARAYSQVVNTQRTIDIMVKRRNILNIICVDRIQPKEFFIQEFSKSYERRLTYSINFAFSCDLKSTFFLAKMPK